MSEKLKRSLLIVGMLVAAVGLAAGLSRLKPPPEKKEADSIASLVEVMPLRLETVRFSVDSQGTVRPRTETVLSAEVPGAVVSISPKFIAGGMFEANEELLRIDPTTYEVAVEQAEALLAQRQIEYDGAVKLQREGYRAEAELAAAKAALATANADVVRARRNLERTRIRLPYAGMVRSKEADVGQYVNVGSRLGVAFSTDLAEVRLPLTDRDLAFLDLPDPAEGAADEGVTGPAVVLSARQRGETATWNGSIVRTEGVVDETTRVTFAVAAIEDPYLREASAPATQPLPMGTFVTAAIDGVEVEDVIRIPRSALRGNGQLVVVNDESRIEIRDVDVLRTDAEFAYIRAGVSEGDRISLTVIENPINGLLVRTEPVSGETRPIADTR